MIKLEFRLILELSTAHYVKLHLRLGFRCSLLLDHGGINACRWRTPSSRAAALEGPHSRSQQLLTGHSLTDNKQEGLDAKVVNSLE